jgi:hypothetical protein
MTWWGAQDVLDFASGAGFGLHDARLATGLALVATEGNDAYNVCPEGSHDPTARGLFAVHPDLVGHFSPMDLYNPLVNARALLKVFNASGREFDWHPAWNRDAGESVFAMLTALGTSNAWTVRAIDLDRNRRPVFTPIVPMTWAEEGATSPVSFPD